MVTHEPKILLVQVRRPHDPMLAHERACVARRLAARAVALQTENAFAAPADRSWLDGADAVIIGGSGDFSVHDPRSQVWVNPLRALLEQTLESGLPGFGVCFGHQLLGYHLGTPVNTDDRRAELGTVRVELTAEGRADPLFRGLGEAFDVHTGHSDHVVQVPPGVTLLARNDVLQTQAFRVRGARFYTTQFHPDMTGAEAQSRYMAYFEALADGADRAAGVPTTKFQLDADESATLLGDFADLVLTQTGR